MIVVIALLTMLGTAFAGSHVARTYFGVSHDEGTIVGIVCYAATFAIWWVASLFAKREWM